MPSGLEQTALGHAHAPEELGRLASIIESAMDGIITVDESQRIVMFNRAAERIFGVPVAEAMGAALDRFIPERFRKGHAEHIRSFGRTGVTMRAMGRLGTISGLRADGTEFPIEASISQAATDGKRFFTVILRDVSERRKLEEQLLQSQKMEGIGRLAGGVAHDFNNLLMAVFNYIALASRKLEPGHPALSALEHAREAAERAANLTRQLLAFARKQPVAPRVLRARDAVSGLEPMLRQLIGENVALRVVFASDTWPIRVDPTQLAQVIMNLAVNARDAMPRGGTLMIETGNTVVPDGHIPGLSPGDHVVITVTDTGMGMPPEVLERLFEPFFTTKPPGQGTGLGLATCHGIIRQSGGHIAVESQPGRGTSVRVYVPRAAEERVASAGGSAAPAPAGGSETLLLVEDSAMVRDLVAEGLRAAGYTVLVAPTPADAVRIAQSHGSTIDLLVTDVMLPGMTGVELAGVLERSRAMTRAIFMSGSTEEAIPARDGTPRVFLAKPFTVEVLLRKVREVLDGPA